MAEVRIWRECRYTLTYPDGDFLVCTECAHEWSAVDTYSDIEAGVKEAHGNLLQNGDTIRVIKDLKVKGSSLVVKVGTKVKNIRLVDGDHDIDCRIDGGGAMKLKSKFVKKVGPGTGGGRTAPSEPLSNRLTAKWPKQPRPRPSLVFLPP